MQRQRHVELEGTTNLRNLGGYHTNDGTKTTKWGVVYRCDQLADVPVDLAQKVLVGQLHIHHTYDLRVEDEVALKPYDIPHITRNAVPIDTATLFAFFGAGEDMKDPSSIARGMAVFYRDFVRSYGPTLGAIIKGIIASNPSADNASLIHCTAGKDRTGWSCYVLLTLLDVTEAEKRADYILTNTYFRHSPEARARMRQVGLTDAALDAVARVLDEYIDAALDEVEAVGGMHAYVTTCMGMTEDEICKLRGMLLDEVSTEKPSST